MKNALRNFALLFAAVFLFCSTGMAQVAVTVTGNTNTTPNLAASYTSLANAVTALNTVTAVSGPVTLTCAASGVETAPAGGYAISFTATPTAANNITINGNSSTITTATNLTSGSVTDAVFKMVGVSYITLENFTMQEYAGNTTTTAATNNMTEWGVALLFNTANSRGCQNNTITGNTISLSNTYTNSFGIYGNTNHTTAGVTSSFPTSVSATTGANSNNTITSNNISNVNIPIALIGNANASYMDLNNTIGSTISNGNTCTNWGSGTPATAFYFGPGYQTGAPYQGSSGIFLVNQLGFTANYNTLTSNTVAAGSHVWGINVSHTITPSGTYTNNITGNTISVNSANTSTSFGMYAIYHSTGSANETLNITNNNIQNCTITGVSSGSPFVGIINSGNIATLTITGNNIYSGNTTTATTGGAAGVLSTSVAFAGIWNSGTVTTTTSINSNIIGETLSAVNNSAVYGINNLNGASASTLQINSNVFQNFNFINVSSSAVTFITNTPQVTSESISSNNFNNLNLNTTGAAVMMSAAGLYTLGTGTKAINNNFVTSAFNTLGNIALLTDAGSSPAAGTLQYNNNNFSNISSNGLGASMSGFVCNDGGAANKTVSGNTFNGISAGTGAMVVLTVGSGATNSVTGNTISNISGNGTITGLFLSSSAGSATNFNANKISYLTSTGSGTVYGINTNSGAGVYTIYNNTITEIVNEAGPAIGINMGAVGACIIRNNNISYVGTINSGSAAQGIVFAGASSLNLYQDTITNITGYNNGVIGITATLVTGTTNNIYQNIINNITCSTGSNSTANNGISIAGGSTTCTCNLYQNKIYGISGALNSVYGVNESSTATVNAYNNIIGGLSSTYASTLAVIGYVDQAGTSTCTKNLYYNTIYLSGNLTSAGTSVCFYTTGSATATQNQVTLTDNIFINDMTPATGKVYVLQRASSTSFVNYNANSNNNLFYSGTPGTAHVICLANTTAQAQAAYQTAAGTKDNASLFPTTDPGTAFINSTNGALATYLHLNPAASSVCYNAGTTTPAITTDYDGITRATYTGYNGSATKPTIGATEIVQVAADAGVAAFGQTSFCAGTQTVTATITNYGTSTLTAVTVNWSVNGVAQTPVNLTLSLAAGATSTAQTLGTYTFTTGTNVITATTSNPNGVTDKDPSNDAYTQTYGAGLNGIYTVGTSGADFPTLTAAVAAYNAAPICGAVTFSILNNYSSAGESFPIHVLSNTGASATNTLLIKPATGATPVISGSSGIAVVAFDNAIYATLDGSNTVGGTTQDLTILNNSAQGIVIEVANGTTPNTVKNCNIGGLASEGIYLASTAQCTLSNNSIYSSGTTFLGVMIGIDIEGAPSSGSGHLITGNYIGGSATQCGGMWTDKSTTASTTIAAIYNNPGATTAASDISGNTIQNFLLNGVTSHIFYGVYVTTGAANVGKSGSGNTVSNVTLSASGSTSVDQVFAISSAGSTNLVNTDYNTISNIIAYGSGSTSEMDAIQIGSTGTGPSVTNNTINNITGYSTISFDISGSGNTGQNGSVVGIIFNPSSAVTGANIGNNTIYSLANNTTTTTAAPSVIGISTDVASCTGNIYDNKIYDLDNSCADVTTIPGIIGIRNRGGTWNVYNNQVILTNSPGGTAQTNAVRMYGIDDLTGVGGSYYFNSVFIGGSCSGTKGVSAAWDMNKTTTAITLKDNLFYNLRTSTGGSTTAGNFAESIMNGGTAPATFANNNNNDLYIATGTNNYIGIKGAGTTSTASFTTWKSTSPATDAASLNQQVWFNQSNPPTTDLTPSQNSNCLFVAKGVAVTSGIYPPSTTSVGIVYDYAGIARPLSPNTLPNIGAIEFVSTFPTISAGSAQSACLGNTVTMAGTNPAGIDATATGAWTPATGVATPTAYNSSYTGFALGTNSETWTVTDGSCTGNAPVVITGIATPQGSLTGNTVCAPGAGLLTWSASAGTGPYTIVYNNGSTNVTATGVVSGTPFATSPTNPSSNLNCTLVSVTDNGNAQACARTSGFTGGTATVTINSCSTNLTLASGTTFTGATYAPGQTSAVNGTNVNLLGFSMSATGATSVSQLAFTLSGGNTDYTNFRIIRDADNSGTWNTGDVVVGTVSAYATTITFGGLSENINTTPVYYILVADVPCTSTTGDAITATLPVSGITTGATTGGTDQAGGAMTVGSFPATPANPTSNSPQCASTGVTITSATNATGDSWYWESAATGTSVANAATSTENETTAGTYYVRAQNTYGCWSVGAGSTTIAITPAPQGSFTGNTICAGGNGMLTWTATTGTGPYSVVYTSGSPVTATGVVSGTAFASTPATLSTTGTFPLVSVTDANGCVTTTGFTAGTATITVNQLPAITPGTPTSVCPGTASSLTYSGATNSPNKYSIVWNSAATTAGFATVTNATLSSPISIATPSGATAGTYTGTLTVTNSTTTCSNTGYTISVVLNPVPTVSIGASPSNAAICGSGNVVMTANASGGTGTLTYSWSPTTNLQPVAGTASIETSTATTNRTYTVTVKDANLCSVTASQAVTVASAITVAASATPATVCTGGSSQLIANVADANGGYAVSSITYSAPTPVSPTTIAAASYSSTDDGYATVALPFSFNFYGTAYSTLYVGTNGYVAFTSSSTASAGAAIPNTSSPTNVIAPFEKDLDLSYSGSISYYTLGTAPNRQFVISYNAVPDYNSSYTSSTTFNSSNTHTGQVILYEGSNNINILIVNSPATSAKIAGVENSAGTKATAATARNYTSWTVSTPEAWLFTPATVNYTWSPATYLNSTTTYNPTASSIAATTNYNVTATDASTGCSASATASVTTSALSASAGSNVTICAGASTTLTATPTGGCSPFTYNWGSGYTSTATNTVSPSSTTSYTVTIQDNNSNTASASVSVTVNPAPSVSIGANPSNAAICGSGNVVMTANGSGGTGTLTYSWSPTTNLQPVAGTSAIETSTATVNRTYTVTVKDANLCSVTASQAVTVAAAVTVTASATPATVCSGANSQLAATITAGGGNYTVSSITYAAQTPVSPTTAITTGTDDGDGTVTLPFAFNYFGSTIASGTGLTVCSNGWLYMGTTASTSFSPYAFPANTTPTNIIALCFADLETGTGTVTSFTTGTTPNRIFVIAFNGCRFHNGGTPGGTVTGQIQLYESTNVIEIHLGSIVDPASAINKVLGIENNGGTKGYNPAGYNLADFTATSVAFRFTPSTFNYAWSPATYLSSTSIYNPVANSVTATTPYVVTATDASSGCSATATATVTVSALSASAGSNVTICPGTSTTLTATPTGGCSPYTYNWGSGYTSTATNSVSPSSNTTYTVTIQDNNSSTASASVTVTVNPVVTASITTSPANAVSCAGSLVTLTVTAGGGNGTYTYAWSPTNNLQPVAGTSAIESATPTTNRTYTVTVKDGNNCTATATKAVNYSTPPTTQTVNGTTYAACATGATMGLASSQSGVSYQLTLAGVNQGAAVAGTGSAISFSGTHAAGSYVIVATNASGCTTNISATVTSTSVLSGTVTVGATGTYTTLTGSNGLFNAINTGLVSGNIVATINSNITEPGTVALNQWTEVDNTCTVTATPSFTLTVQSDGSVRTLSGNYSSDYLIRLQGADRVTFTGGTGSQHNLVFTNLGSGVFEFYDDCASDVLTNCDVQCGSGSDNNIIIYSSSGATASITVSNNKLHDMAYASGEYAVDGIMVQNTGCTPVISGNSVYNFTLYGIHVYESADNATVTGNNLYMAVSDIYSEGGIYDDATGNGHIITNNTIGGNGSGGNWTYTAANGSTGTNTEFDGIYYTGAESGAAATVTGNTISNFNFSATSPPYYYGIHTSDGAIVIGTSANPNTISNVTVGASGAGDDEIFGVYVEDYGTTDAVNIQYNSIHDLTSQGTTADATSGVFSKVNGVFFGSFSNNGSVSNNTIYNLVTTSRITNSIATTNDDFNDAVVGIDIYANPTGTTVSSNTIYGLRSTTTSTKNTVVCGITVSDGAHAATGTIASNKIYDLTNTSTATSTLPAIVGIRIYETLAWNVYNNQLVLTNSTNTNGVRFYGISDYSDAACNYFYNSVYMGGGASSGTAVSADFSGFSSSSSPTFYNNLMYNERTNTGTATGINYAVSFLGTTPAGFTSDYNDLYSVSTAGTTTYNNVGAKNATNAVALSNWQSQFSGDAHSQSKKVLFSQSNPPVSDLTPNNTTNCWLDGKGKPIVTPAFAIAVPKDYLSINTRNTTTPDIGAIEFTMNANTAMTLASGANSSVTSLAVCAGSTVSATATTSAPATLTYAWTTPDAATEGNVSTFSRAVTTAMGGAYTLTVSDVLACTSTATATLVVNPLPTATISGSTSVCFNSTQPNVTFTGATGTAPYTFTYNINGGSSQTVTTISGNSVTVAVPTSTATTYNYNLVSVQDASSTACSQSQTGTATVTVYGSFTATISGGTSPICYNSAPGTFTATANGGNGSYTYLWYNGSGAVPGATSSTYAPGNLTSNNNYYCAVTSGSCGTINTSITSITVRSVTSATASNTGPYVVGQTISLSSTSAGAVSYSWSGPSGYTATGQNVTISNSTLAMSGTYTVTATTVNGCTATASTNVLVATNATYVWTGNTNTSWTVVTNWSPTAPAGGPNACAVDVIIPSVTNAPVITSAVQVGDVQIDAGAQITINAASLNVCKNWVGSSSSTKAVIAGTGTVVMNGSSAQTISGKTQIQELVVSNTAGVNMQTGSAVDVVTALDLASGNFDATNGNLTFKSRTVDSVAIIDNFSSNYSGTLTGNINAERYYATSLTYDQHYMGSPVNSPSLSQFNASGTAGYIVDPTCDETRLPTYSPYGTVFSLHEAHGNGCGMQQWKVETSGSAQNALGYSILKAGNGTLTLNGGANLSTSYSVSGLTNSGWSNITAQNRTIRSGWQLVSNPYLATLNLTNIPSGFDNQVQVWNANGPYAGSYQPYTVGVDAVIPPFQAFMVHKTSAGGTATYVINANERVRTPRTFYQQNANQLNIVAANVSNGMLDQTMVAFNAAATDTFDADIDATKMPGALKRHTLYTVNNGMWMSRNTLHDETTTSTVPMGFEPGANGTYTLSFNGLNTFDATSYIYLEDKALNVMYNVRNGDYTFTADSTDNWDRFVLHFTPPAVVNTNDASCITAGTISIQQPGTANWNYTLTDAGNAIITSGTLNQSQQVTAGVPAGTYTLTLIDTNSYTVTKTIVVIGPEMVTAQFDVPANAVQVNQSVALAAVTQNASTYQWNFGNGTSATGAATSVAYSQPGVYTVSLLVTSSAGCTSTKTQTITVNDATGINNLSGTGEVRIWSHSNKVYVDLTALHLVDANVIIYDILGQQISNERVTSGSLTYQKEIDNIDAAYFIVMVRNDDKITTKKVFITNSK